MTIVGILKHEQYSSKGGKSVTEPNRTM